MTLQERLTECKQALEQATEQKENWNKRTYALQGQMVLLKELIEEENGKKSA